MNKYITTHALRRGVSPWITIAVVMAVVALIFTLLPTSTARSDEAVLDDGAVIGVADDLDVSIDPDVIGEEEALPESVDEVADVLVTGEDRISPMQLSEPHNWGDLTVHAETKISIDEVTLPTVPKEVGTEVWVSGKWDGSTLDLQPGESFEIHLPDVVELRPLGGFPLLAADEPGQPEWGYCTPQQGQNFFLCDIEELPGTSASGTWTGWAIATSTSEEFNIVDAAFRLGKAGEMAEFDEDLAGEPYGTVFRWQARISSPGGLPLTINEPIVLEDTFSDNLRVCTSEDADVTRLQVRYRGTTYTDIATLVQSSDTSMTITVTPPDGGFSIGTGMDHGIDVMYSLCTESGGLDASGTVYENTVNWNSLTVVASVTQRYASEGTIVALDRGTFSLNKVVTSPNASLDGVGIPDTIDVLVEEFAPGVDLSDEPNASYTLAAETDGTVITGQNSRPDGWKIRLTEIPPVAVPGFNWGTPVFSGDGVDTGVDGAGNPFALITTNADSNVEVSLENFLSSDDPETGISFPLPDTGDGLALWVLFAVTGVGLVGVIVFMVRNNRSRKLSEEDDS